MTLTRRNFMKQTACGVLTAGILPTLLSAGTAPDIREKKSAAPGNGMKLSFYPYELQLRHVFTVASYSRKTTPGVQVVIEYDGLTGYGEASMPPYLGETILSVCDFLQKVNLANFNDPLRMDEILAYVDSIAPSNTAAKAAVDIALHDLTGKILGAPWYKIWGLSAEKAPSTTYTIGIDKPDVVLQKTREAADKFNILKVKVGLDTDEEMITTIRKVTPKPLAVDANQGWKSKEEALDKIHWLAGQGIVMVEQPLSKQTPDDLAWLTERSPLPIFADESLQRLDDVLKLKGVVSGINIKLMKCTGMREAWKMANLAQALGMRVMIGCMTETSCAISAAAQLAPLTEFADLDGNLLISNDLFNGVTVENGKITLNDTPGIGIRKKETASL